MNKRTRKSAVERKAEILDTAIVMAAQVGPDGLTTEQLAREIGITQAAIFRHFPTKSDIWMGVAARIGEMLTTSSRIEFEEGSTPIDKIRALVRRQLQFINQTPAIPAILFSRELHAKNENMRRLFSTMMDNRQKLFEALIAQAMQEKQFDSTLNPDSAAMLILSMIQGLAMRWSLTEQGFDLVEEGEGLLEMILAGFHAA